MVVKEDLMVVLVVKDLVEAEAAMEEVKDLVEDLMEV